MKIGPGEIAPVTKSATLGAPLWVGPLLVGIGPARFIGGWQNPSRSGIDQPDATKAETLAEAMKAIDWRWSHRKASQYAGHAVPATAERVVAPLEALLLAAGFREVLRLEATRALGRDSEAMMRTAEMAVYSLEESRRAVVRLGGKELLEMPSCRPGQSHRALSDQFVTFSNEDGIVMG